MTRKSYSEDPAFASMTLHFLSNILTRADNPANMGDYLNEDIRELTGAQLVLFVQNSDADDRNTFKVASINPKRKQSWTESQAAFRFYQIVHEISSETIWRADEYSEGSQILKQQGFNLSLSLPLTIGAFRIGTMLVLGLPTDQHLSSELEMLKTLSGIVALILRNAFLYEKQDQIIKERSLELVESNEQLRIELAKSEQTEVALRDSEKKIGVMLEESEKARMALLCILEDEKLIEQQLSDSEVKFRNLFENSPIGNSITGLDGSLQVNKTFCNILGYSKEELRIKKWKDITYPDDIPLNDDFIKSMIDGKTDHVRIELRYIHKNGNIVWADLSTYLQKDENGENEFFITSLHDITERKLAEEKLKTNQILLRSIIDGTTDAVYVKDQNGKYIIFNKSASEMVGKNEEEVIGNKDIDIFPLEDGKAIMEADRRIMESGSVNTIEEFVTLADGKKHFFLSTKGPLINNDGKVTGLFGIARDITERKQAEEKIIDQLNELRRWNEAMLDREERVMELKSEVNQILKEFGKPSKYNSV